MSPKTPTSPGKSPLGHGTQPKAAKGLGIAFFGAPPALEQTLHGTTVRTGITHTSKGSFSPFDPTNVDVVITETSSHFVSSGKLIVREAVLSGDGDPSSLLLLEAKLDTLISEGRARDARIDALARALERMHEVLSSRSSEPTAAIVDDSYVDLGPSGEALLRTGNVDAMLAPFTLPAEAVDRRLEDDPDMLDATAFAGLVGVSPQAVHQKRGRGEVIGLTRAKRKVWFPRAQIDEHGRLIPGLSELLKACEGDEWETYRFLIQPQLGLGGATPHRALLEGRVGEVLTLLHGIREGGFG